MLKKILKKIIFREKASSEDYVSWLRKHGVKIGEDVSIYAPTKTKIDVTCPWLLKIGSHVRITEGVTILTHDYAWSVLKNAPKTKGAILGAQSPVTIGDNVFIGMNTVITRGVSIGNNVIIGAGSVVTKDCGSDAVYAGNPARKIMSLSEYYEKRASLQHEEAKKLVQVYRDAFGEDPPKEVFFEYFMLFCTSEEATAVPAFKRQMELGTGGEDSVLYLREHSPRFSSFEEFLETCK